MVRKVERGKEKEGCLHGIVVVTEHEQIGTLINTSIVNIQI